MSRDFEYFKDFLANPLAYKSREFFKLLREWGRISTSTRISLIICWTRKGGRFANDLSGNWSKRWHTAGIRKTAKGNRIDSRLRRPRSNLYLPRLDFVYKKISGRIWVIRRVYCRHRRSFWKVDWFCSRLPIQRRAFAVEQNRLWKIHQKSGRASHRTLRKDWQAPCLHITRF